MLFNTGKKITLIQACWCHLPENDGFLSFTYIMIFAINVVSFHRLKLAFNGTITS